MCPRINSVNWGMPVDSKYVEAQYNNLWFLFLCCIIFSINMYWKNCITFMGPSINNVGNSELGAGRGQKLVKIPDFVYVWSLLWKCCEFKNTFAQLWREDRRRPLARRHWKLVEHKKVSLSCTIIAVRKRYLTSILTFWLSKKLLVNYGFMKVSVQGIESLPPILCLAF